MRRALSALLLAAGLCPAPAQVPRTDPAFFGAATDAPPRGGSAVVSTDHYAAWRRPRGAGYMAESGVPAGIRPGGRRPPAQQMRGWVRQRAKTPLFRFDVAYADTAAGADGRRDATPMALRVLARHTGRVRQVLPLAVDEPTPGACWAALVVLDANFDGWPDLRVYASSAGGGANALYRFYLFEPRTGRFVFQAALSDLTDVALQPRTRTIASAFRNGCGQRSSAHYRFLRGHLTCTASHVEDCLEAPEGYCTVYEGRLVRGKWVEKTWRIKE